MEQEQVSRNAIIASEVVDVIFEEVNICIQTDRSRMHLGWAEKAVIGGMLGKPIRDGIKSYIFQMNEEDIAKLVNKIRARVNSEVSIQDTKIDSNKINVNNVNKVNNAVKTTAIKTRFFY